MSKFTIAGSIADSENDKESADDVIAKDVVAFLDSCGGEDVEIEITSGGGSVFQGISIANALKRYSGKVTTHAVGICASIASVILMAGDEIVVDSNCFVMVHNPWSMIAGNSADMRKEADTLDKCRDAMLSFYRAHFDRTDEEIIRMLDEETWILGADAEAYGLKCRILESDEPLKIAAKINLKKYNKLPEGLKMEEEKKEPVEETKVEELEEENKEQIEQALAEVEKPEEEQTEEKPAEEEQTEQEDDTPEDKEKKCEDSVPADEVEKRVSGMQAKMQLQINDFKNQLKAKDEELTQAKAEITSLAGKLEDAARELQSAVSALEEKKTALAQLNAGVLSPADEIPTFAEGLARCKSPAERVAFIKSGKYRN